MKRFKCWLRHVRAYLKGERWDGHCWDSYGPDPDNDTSYTVICVDCDKIEKG